MQCSIFFHWNYSALDSLEAINKLHNKKINTWQIKKQGYIFKTFKIDAQ